jgi:hypothetical protein
MLMTATIAGREYRFAAEDVQRVARRLDPEPIDVWFAMVDQRRFPPKQLVEALTGLDRADFNSHQARALLARLGFPVERRRRARSDVPLDGGPLGGAEARALAAYVGRWVAQDGLEILYDADSPDEVARWLRRHGRRARVWRVPGTAAEVGSTSSVP